MRACSACTSRTTAGRCSPSCRSVQPERDAVVLRLAAVAAGVEGAVNRGFGRDVAVPVPSVDQRRAGLVRIRQVVELPAARAGVFDAAGQRLADLLLQRQAVEVRIRRLDVLVDVAQAAAGMVLVTPATPPNGPALST